MDLLKYPVNLSYMIQMAKLLLDRAPYFFAVVA